MSSHDPHAFHAHGLPGPGDSVGGYSILRQVGQGGMAVVFEGRHQSLGKRVAVKMLLPHHAARTDIARRFMREGEAAARLNHPHAVDVTDVGKDARGAPYLVMEFLEGEDLASLLDRGGKLSVEQTADILVPVISAIGAAHDLGIVHRDLKPQNIFLAKRRQEIVPKVVDFGISKIEAESMKLTGTEALLGTPYYMSPEQAQGASNVDARTDQFAIGVMLYECVTGKRPFDGGSLYSVLAQIIHGSPTPPSQLVPQLDPTFELILAQALHKDPAKRYRDVRAFGAALIALSSFRTQLSYGADFGVSTDAQRLQKSARPSTSEATGQAGNARSGVRSQPPREHDAPRASESSRTRRPDDAATEQPSPTFAKRVPLLIGSLLVVALLTYLTVRVLQQGGGTGDASSASAPEGPAARERLRPPDLPVPEYQVSVRATPDHAVLLLDGAKAGVGQLLRKLPTDGKSHRLEVAADGFHPQSIEFVDQPPPAAVVLEPLPSAPTLLDAAVARPLAGRGRRLSPLPATPSTPAAPTTRSEPSAATEAPPVPLKSAPTAPLGVTPAPSEFPAKRYGTNGAPIVR